MCIPKQANGLVNALNKKLFLLKRLSHSLDFGSLLRIANAIFMSKIRYGLQLFGKVRWSIDDTIDGELNNLQKIQNKMVRQITKTKLSDKVCTEILLNKCNLLSINQIMGQIKALEAWKSVHLVGYSVTLDFK